MSLLHKLLGFARSVNPNDNSVSAEPDITPSFVSPLINADGSNLPERAQPGYYPGFSVLAQQSYWDAATRSLIQKRLAEIPSIRFFTPAEEQTMRAVVDRLLPQEDRVPEFRIEILPFIDDRLHMNRIEGYRYDDMPSDQEAYRIAAAAFERMAEEVYQQPFHALDTLSQEKLLKSIHDAEPLAAKDLWSKLNIERLWSLLVSDCCSVYYAHPYAWDEIGFGGPAYPRGYMRLEEGEPEPWEVNESRYAWHPPANTLSGIEEPHGSGRDHQTHPGQGGTH